MRAKELHGGSEVAVSSRPQFWLKPKVRICVLVGNAPWDSHAMAYKHSPSTKILRAHRQRDNRAKARFVKQAAQALEKKEDQERLAQQMNRPAARTPLGPPRTPVGATCNPRTPKRKGTHEAKRRLYNVTFQGRKAYKRKFGGITRLKPDDLEKKTQRQDREQKEPFKRPQGFFKLCHVDASKTGCDRRKGPA